MFYSDFRKTPDSMRLQIVELKLNVLQIIRYTKPPENGITEPMTTPRAILSMRCAASLKRVAPTSISGS